MDGKNIINELKFFIEPYFKLFVLLLCNKFTQVIPPQWKLGHFFGGLYGFKFVKVQKDFVAVVAN